MRLKLTVGEDPASGPPLRGLVKLYGGLATHPGVSGIEVESLTAAVLAVKDGQRERVIAAIRALSGGHVEVEDL